MRKGVVAMRQAHLLRHYIRERDRLGPDAAGTKLLAREVKLLIVQLRSWRDLPLPTRTLAAELLQQVLDTPSVMKALNRSYGAKKKSRGLDLAIDYLIQCKRLGKAAAALADVRQHSGATEKEVKDAVTYWREKAAPIAEQMVEALDTVRGKDFRAVLAIDLVRAGPRSVSPLGRKK